MKFPKIPEFPNYIRALVVVALCGVVGAYFLVASHASTPTASVEAESGTVSSAASTVADTTASASSAVKFGSSSGATTCTVGQTGGSGNCMAPPATAASGKTWKVTFADDFNSSSLDTTKWTSCFDWNYGDCTSSFNQGYEHYEPSAITLSGGLAHLNATPLPDVPSGQQTPACSLATATKCSGSACLNSLCIYKSGLLATSRKNGNDPITSYLYKFTYGYVEASLKVPGTQGFFIAWWMLPADPTFNYTYDPDGTPDPSSPWRYEIDTLEALGSDPTDMEMHYHYGNGSNDHYSPNETGPGTNGNCPTVNYSQAQHRFGVDWEPTFVAFYIDGVKCGQMNATANTPVPNVPMQLIMDQMVNNNWQRSIGKPLLNTSLTNDVQVDYVHVYQQQ